MTTEEAIELLYDIQTDVVYNVLSNEKEALDMAIKALEQQPCEDCISREAVDEYITNLLSGYLYDEERTRLEDLTAFVWELPSVTPKPCVDAISRAGALRHRHLIYDDDGIGYSVVRVDEIMAMPSVTPKAEQKAILDKIRAEIEQLTSRYSISKERGGMGQVEWSDRLIKESDVLQIIDKYKAESEIHCNCTNEEIAKSFIEDVEAVKDLLPKTESEDKE